MSESKKNLRQISRSVVEAPKEHLSKDSENKKKNCLYLCSLLRKHQTMKSFQGFVKIIAKTNKSY